MVAIQEAVDIAFHIAADELPSGIAAFERYAAAVARFVPSREA